MIAVHARKAEAISLCYDWTVLSLCVWVTVPSRVRLSLFPNLLIFFLAASHCSGNRCVLHMRHIHERQRVRAGDILQPLRYHRQSSPALCILSGADPGAEYGESMASAYVPEMTAKGVCSVVAEVVPHSERCPGLSLLRGLLSTCPSKR